MGIIEPGPRLVTARWSPVAATSNIVPVLVGGHQLLVRVQGWGKFDIGPGCAAVIGVGQSEPAVRGGADPDPV